MRFTSLFLLFIVLGGCSDGASLPEASADQNIAADSKEKAATPPSRLATKTVAELTDFYLHFYDREEQGRDVDLLYEVEEELIVRGGESIDELLKYSYCLNKYPYSVLSLDLIEAIGLEAKNAIPHLAKVLRDPTGQHQVVNCLVMFGPDSIPELVKYYNGDDLHVTWAASIPLKRLGADVVPYMKPSLKSSEEERRKITMDVLSAIGPDAADLIRDVRHLLDGDTYSNRLTAARTLANLGDTESGLAYLFAEVDRWSVELSAHDDPPFESYWALVALGRCEVSDPDPIIDKLFEAIKHPNASRRNIAIDSFKPHGRSIRVQETLRDMLKREDWREHHPVIAGLFGRWGSQFKLDQEDLVIELLEQAASNTDEDRAYMIRSHRSRIEARRWIESVQQIQNSLE